MNMEIVCTVEDEFASSFPGVCMVEETPHFHGNFQCVVWQHKSISTVLVSHKFPSRHLYT